MSAPGSRVALTVLNVAYPLAPVGPNAVGGAEQVLARLDAALVRAGHQSIVVACEGSETNGVLVPVPRYRGPLDKPTHARAIEDCRRAVLDALGRWRVDLVHMHGVDFHEYLPPPGVPVLATLHLPPEWYPAEVFRLSRPRTFLHCVSASQRRRCPSSSLLLSEIENGVAPKLFSVARVKGRFAVSLGRICPEKGFHLAFDAAARVGFPFVLGGEVFGYEAHQSYFRREIIPRLSPACRFIGPVGMERKRRLLARARCLLAPSLAAETSSLVAMEALACGTPVVAFPSGALGDIVEHGKTGFLVRTEVEMAEAIERAGEIDSEQCREAARLRFSLERMVQKYFEHYRLVAESKAGGVIQQEANGASARDGNARNFAAYSRDNHNAGGTRIPEVRVDGTVAPMPGSHSVSNYRRIWRRNPVE